MMLGNVALCPDLFQVVNKCHEGPSSTAGLDPSEHPSLTPETLRRAGPPSTYRPAHDSCMADAFLSSQLPNPPALGAPAPTTAGLKLLVASRRCTSSMRMSSLRLCLTAISPRTLAPRSHRWPTGTLEDHIALGRLHVHLNTAGHLHSPNLHVPDLEVHIPAAVGPQEKLSTRSQCGGCCKAWRNQPISLISRAELRLGHVHHQLRQLYGEDLAACTVLGLQRKPNNILCIYVHLLLLQ